MVYGRLLVETMTELKMLLIDVDGVLTDGKVYVTHEGDRFKAFSARDNRAIAEFVARGWEVHIVTTSKWPGLKGFIDESKVFVHEGVNKTQEAIHEITRGEPFVAVGDDMFDEVMLLASTIGYVPKDADPGLLYLIRPSYLHVHELPVKGGCGVIAELARILL